MFDPAEILLELPAYQHGGRQTLDETTQPWTIGDSTLFPIAPFLWGPYWPRIEIFPRLQISQANGGLGVGLAARQQIEDSIVMPSRSFLVGWSTISPQAAGFLFTLFDVGRNDWAITPKWMSSKCVAGKPDFLTRPYAIVDAGNGWGKLQLRMVNQAAVANDCQLALWFAVPAGKVRTIQDPGSAHMTTTQGRNW